MPKSVKVLFICIGNSCRSQMAEALARHRASDVIEPSSAGIATLGEIAEATQMVLAECGVPMDGQYSKGLSPEDCEAVDLIINMTGRPWKTLFPNSRFLVEDWDIADPYGRSLEMHREICDDIEARIDDLAARLRAQQTAKLGGRAT